jgi:UV DNA damage endonuclease
MIHLGYVGINTLLQTASKTFRLANYSSERMLEISRKNLHALREILQWNVAHRIKLFRITSGLIPFGSHSINSGIWKKDLREDFQEIGDFIRRNFLRVSMHPGQYTVINTPDSETYERSLKDLQYHCAVLDLMELDGSHKIVIHGGGIYGRRQYSTEVLLQRLEGMSEPIRKRLVIENDERNFSAADIYTVCKRTGYPGVLDIFHHQCFPSFKNLGIREIVEHFRETWPDSQRQKIHYSNQAPQKHRGAHSEGIDLEQFSRFYENVKDMELDIMLETKDKQQSVLKVRKSFPEIS